MRRTGGAGPRISALVFLGQRVVAGWPMTPPPVASCSVFPKRGLLHLQPIPRGENVHAGTAREGVGAITSETRTRATAARRAPAPGTRCGRGGWGSEMGCALRARARRGLSIVAWRRLSRPRLPPPTHLRPPFSVTHLSTPGPVSLSPRAISPAPSPPRCILRCSRRIVLMGTYRCPHLALVPSRPASHSKVVVRTHTRSDLGWARDPVHVNAGGAPHTTHRGANEGSTALSGHCRCVSCFGGSRRCV
jgi:hypothetical protein